MKSRALELEARRPSSLTLDNEVSHSTSVEVRDMDELVKRLLSDDLIDVGELR